MAQSGPAKASPQNPLDPALEHIQVSPLALVDKTTLDPAEAVRPWERMPRETDTAWALFQVFRDLAYPDGPVGRFHPRNIERMAEATGLSGQYLRTLSSSFHWFQRSGAYDRALDRAKTDATLSEVARARRSHLDMSGQLKTWARMELDKMLARAQDPELPTATPKEIAAIVESVIKLERLLLGESTENIRVEDGGGWDLEGLALEDLQELDRLRQLARGGG